MKSVSAGLQAVIDAREVKWAFIWKLKRRNGVIYAYTEHDQPLDVDLGDGDGLVTYQPGTISVPSEPDQSIGVKVDSAELEGATGLIMSTPALQLTMTRLTIIRSHLNS